MTAQPSSEFTGIAGMGEVSFAGTAPGHFSMHNLMLTLRQLVQEAGVASTSRKRVRGIVVRVKSAMSVGVCSLYLADEDGTLTLAATEGLNPGSEGRIRLRSGEGLVGKIARTQHPLNVESASQHPHFRYFPETGEERFEAFLGAPVVHAGKLVGVLVVEQQARRKFSEEEESFLVTVAAHLGGLSPDDFQLEPDGTLPAGDDAAHPMRRFKGVRGAPGIGIGRLHILSEGAGLMNVADSEADDIEAELAAFRRAVDAVCEDLAEGQRTMARSISHDVADVFEVYRMLLQGREISGGVERAIVGGLSAAASLRTVVSAYVTKFEEMEDPYFRARGEDIRSLGDRVFARLRASHRPDLGTDEKVVLAGTLVSIADIAAYPVEQLAGIVSVDGSTLSHTAVLAKALGLPAVMGIEHLADLPEDELVVVDGFQGRVLLSPTHAVRREFERLIDSEQMLLADLGRLKDLRAETPDGVTVNLFANTGLLADITPGLVHGAEGIGLYRSEIPFMVRGSFPSEEEQVEVYRTVLEAYRGMPVYMRTLDVGGDKPLPYYTIHEENPALGWRGVRFTLDNSVVLMTQLRAMLRASRGAGKLHIMFPMVGAVAQVETCLALLDSACEQLGEEGIEVVRPRVGIMVEVPAAISILPFLADRIDFLSVGSNDLSQYLLAVDRNNSRVAHLFDHLHPAVLEAVEETSRRGVGLGLPVSVCGEMAADPCAVVLLLGMGIEALSMAAYSIPRIKWLVRTVTRTAAREQLELAKRSAHPDETRDRLRQFLIGLGLEKLLDPPGTGTA